MKDKIEKVQLIITPKSVFLVVGIILLLVLIYKLTAVLYIFFISFSIYSSLKPIINRLEKRNRIQKAISIPLILATFLIFLTLLVALVVQNLSIELKNINMNELVDNFIQIVEDKVPFIAPSDLPPVEVKGEEKDVGSAIDSNNLFTNSVVTGGGNFIIQLLSSTAGLLLSIFTIFVVAYYMLLKKGYIFDGLLNFIPDRNSKTTIRKYIDKVESKLGSWLMSQFILMLLVGILSYLGVAIPMLYFGTETFPIAKFAVTLAVISGILEVIPTIGPIITFVIAVFLSIAVGGDYIIPQTLYIATLFIMVQQIEAGLIVPHVMKQAVGLDPIVTVLGVIAGGILGGPIGAILVIPVIATAQIVIEFFVNEEEFFASEPTKLESFK